MITFLPSQPPSASQVETGKRKFLPVGVKKADLVLPRLPLFLTGSGSAKSSSLLGLLVLTRLATKKPHAQGGLRYCFPTWVIITPPSIGQSCSAATEDSRRRESPIRINLIASVRVLT